MFILQAIVTMIVIYNLSPFIEHATSIRFFHDKFRYDMRKCLIEERKIGTNAGKQVF